MESSDAQMLTPTKSKALAFDIEVTTTNSTPSKSAMKVKERLEQRKMMMENGDE